ncbi:hypothetical protein [Planktothrix sp. FACHB-1365]|uniref:hypothetical protein n=1 Tax=Planktothrix sp. FACHB-1365 TaxID=2692855 RepID=UPI001681CE95|nr:hypothetical protein [Planktothrix sp. FACHB-1365]MBD2484649.1 hypothetical protein [Planktothrix sp. FACHB-1365]
MKEFGLTPEQTRILFSYQYYIVQTDIDCETNFQVKPLKIQWLSKWKKSTENFLTSQTPSDQVDQKSVELITNIDCLKDLVHSSILEAGNQLTRYLILLEVTLFKPYYNLGDGDDEQFKNLKIADEVQVISQQKLIAATLNINSDCVDRFQSNYQEAIGGLKGGINPWFILAGSVFVGVLAFFFTPVIVGLLAPILAPGLSGAAAISAVLAALGGGAIAAGGFGMMGGMAVIIAGGSILGAGASVAVGFLFAQSPEIALTQAAKLEVIFKEIIYIQKDIGLAQEIIKEQRQAIRSLEDKLDELMMNKQENQQEIDNLKQAIEYLKKALERNQGLL